jgi:hypothetical protein
MSSSSSFVEFSNVSGIFLAFKYMYVRNILTTPFVDQRVFLASFSFKILLNSASSTVANRADGNSSSILFFLCTDVKEPQMKDAPWLDNVAERRKILLDRGILESIFLFLAHIGVTLQSTLILAHLRLTSHVPYTHYFSSWFQPIRN